MPRHNDCVPVDRPRGPERPDGHWSDGVAAREDRIERQWRDARIRDLGSRVKLEAFRVRAYRREGYGARNAAADRAAVPAPFRPEVAARVPDRKRGDRTTGRLDLPHAGELMLTSGAPSDNPFGRYVDRLRDPDSGELPTRLGFSRFNHNHVEARVAAYMRARGIVDATLYLNHRPCRDDPAGCDVNLPKMLPPGARLTVYGTSPRPYVYRGDRDADHR